MSQTTIDIGIDLGTTNSTIARLQQGVPFIIPNNEGSPVTPSVIRINRNGDLFVGKKAYDFLVSDPENTKGEFKRSMGLDTPILFEASGRTMTPTELSAEVLKKLLGDLATQGGTAREAVITVPAAFDLNQCSATNDAARMAGIVHSPLLQEPIAASLAYGYRLDLEGKSWLVYDLGGGTFDLALVGVRDGRAQVIDHEGDNHLGGKEMDWLLLRSVVLPELAKRYEVSSLYADSGDAEARGKLAKLKALVEYTKISLTREESSVLTIETLGKPLVDDRGEIIEVDLVVQRRQYEEAIAALVDRTISMSSEVLSRNPSVDVEAVLLVGGPTLTPLVRNRLAESLGLRIDTSANPLTVVAEGAALYAASQPLVETRPAAVRTGTITLELAYKTVTDDEVALVGGRAPSSVSTVEIVARDGSWSSGELALPEGKFSTRVPLPKKGLHEFGVAARSSDGTVVDVTPNLIAITRGLTAAAAPLSRSLGVVIEDPTGEQEVQWLIHKNTPLPARGVHEFRTSIELEPGGEIEVIQVHLVEGMSESTRPDRHRRVGDITITDSHVSKRVPAGNPIEIRIDVDESRLLTSEAYLPIVDQKFEVRLNLGTDAIEAHDLRQQTERERARVASLVQYGSAATVRELNEALRQIESELATSGGHDPDGVQLVHRRLQEVSTRIDALEDAQRLPMTIAEAREESELASQVVMESGDGGHKARLRALTVDLDDAIESGSVPEIRRVRSKLTRLRFEILTALPAFWADYFNYMCASVSGWTDDAAAEVLKQQGRSQLVREDFTGLRDTCIRLRGLVRPDNRSQLGRFENVGLRN